MNKHDKLTLIRQITALRALGVNDDDISKLHYHSTRLQNWHVRLCNDTEVDDDTGKACRVIPDTGARYKTPNLGKSHELAVGVLAVKYPQAKFVINRDPRGYPIKFGEDERGFIMNVPHREVIDTLYYRTTKEI
jgi:hypothetical protein